MHIRRWSKSNKFASSFFFFIGMLFFVQSVFAANSITGTVYDFQNNSLGDVDIELSNELGAFISHKRTDSTGRFAFTNLSDGRFTVRVMPFRYDYEEQTREVELYSPSVAVGGGSTFEEIEFKLSPRKGGLAYSEAKVIFAQEVPNTAKKSFEKGILAISKNKKEEGIIALKDAVQIFPTYFLALHNLGKAYFAKGDYGESAKYLIRAADVNVKSPKTFYLLGYSLHLLKYYKAAIVALKQAYTLSPASTEVLTVLGTAERLNGNFTEAETYLKQAKKVAKFPSPEVYWQLALLYGENLKKYDAALKELEGLLKTKPTPEEEQRIKAIIKNIKAKIATAT